TRLLWRSRGGDPQPRSFGLRGVALSALLVERTGLCTCPYDPDQWVVPDQYGFAAYAQPGAVAFDDAHVPTIPSCGWPLLYQSEQGGLQPREAGPGLGRFVGHGALEPTRSGSAILRGRQFYG